MANLDEASITLAVLAGGKGSRMGFPKAQIRIQGRPILGQLMQRICWRGPRLLVTAPGRTRPQGCDAFEREVVDPVVDQGPLRGMLTALDACKTEVLIAITMDMPWILRDQLLHLAAALTAAPGAAAIMLRRGPDENDQLEPFPSIYRRHPASEIVRKQLDAGERSMKSLAELQGIQVQPAIASWPTKVWTNLNFPADLPIQAKSHQE
jgi:molybdopterin-guanine dinucleotide biosynthesis protein A